MKMIVCVILAGLLSVSLGEINLRRLVQQDYRLKYNQYGPDAGHFKNCGTAKNFSMEWSPKDLLPRGNIKAKLNLITPFDWAEGKVTAAVYLKDLPDTPILRVSQGVSCSELKKYTPAAKCPYKAQDFISLAYEADKLPALPTGQYIVKVQLDNSKGQEIVCGMGDVNIVDS